MAEIKPSCGLEREWLYKCIPLKTPFTLNIVTSTVCNFKCEYCVHSLRSEEKNALGLKPEVMDMQMFQKILEQIEGRHPDDAEKAMTIHISNAMESFTGLIAGREAQTEHV